ADTQSGKAAPSSRKGRPSSRQLPLGGTLLEAEDQDHRRRWWVFGVVAVLGVVLVVGVLILLSKPSHAPPGRTPILYVTQQAGAQPDHFKSVRAALEAAKPGDSIVLLDPVHKERLLADGKKNAKLELRVTVTSAEGKEVVWGPPTGSENQK